MRQHVLVRVGPLTTADTPEIEGLADVLMDCVASGASVGFLAPLGRCEARQWWRETLQERHGLTWVAYQNGKRIVGVVRLMLATQANAKHRAEVAKLLVHRDARGAGCASMLMSALEEGARQHGRTLLTLDTQTGSVAERLYERWGWQRIGVIENYAASPNGQLTPTTLMAKHL